MINYLDRIATPPFEVTSQSGETGKFLKTDGNAVSWVDTPVATSTTFGGIKISESAGVLTITTS